MKTKDTLLIILLLISHQFTSSAQNLERRANRQSTIKGPQNNEVGETIIDIEDDSPLSKAGLKSGDLIVEVENQPLLNSEIWSSIKNSIKSDKKMNLLVKRAGFAMSYQVKFNLLQKKPIKELTPSTKQWSEKCFIRENFLNA